MASGAARRLLVFGQLLRVDGVWAALSLLGQRRVDVFTSALVPRRVDRDAGQPRALQLASVLQALAHFLDFTKKPCHEHVSKP